MSVTMVRQDLTPATTDFNQPWQCSSVRELSRLEEQEVLAFLDARPIRTVFMSGLIRDHGLISPRNRGSFYGFRTRNGQLEGVALIGHATLVEAHTEQALIAFARVARNCQNTHLIRGDRQTMDVFWRHYAEDGQEPRLVRSEQLLEMAKVPALSAQGSLRPATMAELEKILAVNSALAFEEGGINPLQIDPTGFRSRTIARIENDRVWVRIENDHLLFKGDIVSHTPVVSYLEGIYVHPDERRRGIGTQGVQELAAIVSRTSGAVCLTVDDRHKGAAEFYCKAGFRLHSEYETIYLR